MNPWFSFHIPLPIQLSTILSVVWRKGRWTTSLIKIPFISLLFWVIYFICTSSQAPTIEQLLCQRSSLPVPISRAGHLCFFPISDRAPLSTSLVKLKQGRFPLPHLSYRNELPSIVDSMQVICPEYYFPVLPAFSSWNSSNLLPELYSYLVSMLQSCHVHLHLPFAPRIMYQKCEGGLVIALHKTTVSR